jgi:hypothetical protein
MAVFELVEPWGRGIVSGAAPDVFGVWATTRPVPSSPEGIASPSLSFAPGGPPESAPAPAPDIPVWRANLPADLEQAQRDLASGQARLEASRRALPTAQKRITGLAERARSAPQDRDHRNLSFALSPRSTPPSLLSALHASTDEDEAEFLDALIRIEQGGEEVGRETGVSFGLGESLAEGREHLQEQAQGFINSLFQSVASYVRVETEIGGMLVAWTSVGWTGDVRTVWQTSTPPEHMPLHHHTLRLALSSRDTLFRSIAIAVQGVVQLSVLLSTPGGVVLALPVAWRFINRLLKQGAGAEGA